MSVEKPDGDVISDFMKEYNTPENVKMREDWLNLADEILASAIGCEKSELKNNQLISCLRENFPLYKKYVETLKKDKNYNKYFQKYTFKGKEYMIIPTIEDNDRLHVQTFEITQKNGKYSFLTEGQYNRQGAFYSGYSDLIQVNFPDATAKDKFSTLYMNKWTGKITNENPYNKKMDTESVKGLMETIEEKGNTKLSDCSESLQSSVENILGNENELDNQGKGFAEQRTKIAQCVMKGDFAGAVGGFIEIVKLFFTRKSKGRVVGLGNGLNYEGDERDLKYLESAINTVLDPEKRSELTYMLAKIKDLQTKKTLNDNGIENPSQFDLFLQNCEPGQVILTNGLDKEGKSSAFDHATQVVSGARWCHSIIVSDVIKDNNGIVKDVEIIQSTYKGGVHKTTLREYASNKFSSVDLLLANIPKENREKVINAAKSRIGQKYDTVSVVTDSVLGMDVDDSIDDTGIIGNVLGENKAYCSELVFDAIKQSGLNLPEPHLSPSDLLRSEDTTPQYACYCDKF